MRNSLIIAHISLQEENNPGSFPRRFNLTHIPCMPDGIESYECGANVVLSLDFE